MGHSFVEVGDKGIWLNDAVLTLVRHFLEREGRRLLNKPDVAAELRNSFEEFLVGFCDHGPGVFVVDFRPMLVGEGQREFLMAVFDRAAQTLRDFSGVIPLAYLQQHVNTPTRYYTRDLDSGLVLKALARVWGLFSEGERNR